MSTDSRDSEELMPEEILEGLRRSSLNIYSPEEVADFLSEWSGREGFVEDLEHVVESPQEDQVSPEIVFEYLVKSDNNYSIEEMLQMAEEWSTSEWEQVPNISSTGELSPHTLDEVFSVPHEQGFLPLDEGYVGEAVFSEDGKNIWLQTHEDGVYEAEAGPLEREELVDFMDAIELMAPASKGFHQVLYGEQYFFLNSSDLDFYFEFEDEVEEFQQNEIETISSEFTDFLLQVYRLHGEEELYRAEISSYGEDLYPLNAYREVFSDEIVDSMKTRHKLLTE